MSETLTQAERDQLHAWFAEELTYERFERWTDDELAALLAPTVERILTARAGGKP